MRLSCETGLCVDLDDTPEGVRWLACIAEEEVNFAERNAGRQIAQLLDIIAAHRQVQKAGVADRGMGQLRTYPRRRNRSIRV